MVATYGFHRYILLYLYRKYKHNTYTPKTHFADLPKVTIQLPMFNEDSVAQRVINATCLIDYPLDKLEIQFDKAGTKRVMASFVLPADQAG